VWWRSNLPDATVARKTNKQPPRQVLFVDDEPDFLQLVNENLAPLSGGEWVIHRASTPDTALELLKQQKMDLVVVDINMPLLDGIQFLKLLGRRHPDLKKVTLTSQVTEENRSQCLAAGAELFIEKPRLPDGFKSVFVMLDELIQWSPQQGFQGMLRRVGLQDVIQMECLGRNSSILEVQDRQLTGRIYIEDGRIIHAVMGAATGEPAFQKLLSLAGGAFQLQPFESPSQRTIEGQWEFLLMEAARVRDESAGLPSEIEPAPEPPPPLKPSAAAVESAVRVVETLICSGQGEPHYQWQCSDAPARVELLQGIAQMAARVGQSLSLGKYDRLEIRLPAGRAVAQVNPDRMVFVQVATENGHS
jgi:CheY-like chemotaxis protein